MRQLSLFTIIPFLLALLAGCAPYAKDILVETELDPKTNISAYKSYAWLGDVSILNDPNEKWQPSGLDISSEIKFIVDRELRASGLHLSDAPPELAVSFLVGADMEAMKLKVDPDSKLESLKNVPEAALVVILMDVATENVVWIGKAEGEVQEGANPEQVRQRIDYAITEMFKELNGNAWF
jgi:hypothetical protein